MSTQQSMTSPPLRAPIRNRIRNRSVSKHFHCGLDIYRIMYVLEWRTVSATREISTKINTLLSAETVRHESTYTILFLTRHKESIDDYKMTIFTHRPLVSLAQFSFCWWRHNRLLMTSQWPDNYDAITLIVLSNSLDINLIQCDVHDRSCKKYGYMAHQMESSLV